VSREAEDEAIRWTPFGKMFSGLCHTLAKIARGNFGAVHAVLSAVKGGACYPSLRLLLAVPLSRPAAGLVEPIAPRSGKG
jgi:hypothetical protein